MASVFMENKNIEKTRPVTITTSSVAFMIFGAVTIVVAVALGIALSSLDSISEVQTIGMAVILFFVAVIGVLDIVAGYGLWYMKRWASVMGMLLGIFGLITQNFSYLLFAITSHPYYGSSVLSAGSPYVNVVLVFLIAISWRSFEPSTS